MSKRKAAEQSQDITPAYDETTSLTNQSPAASPAAETPVAPQRQPGEDTQKSWVKQSTASVIVDPEAGVKFHFDYERHKAAITFNEKPTPEILDVVKPIFKEGKYRWESDPVAWEKNIKFPTREDDRREAKKTFYAVANAIREHKGLPARSFGEALAF